MKSQSKRNPGPRLILWLLILVALIAASLTACGTEPGPSNPNPPGGSDGHDLGFTGETPPAEFVAGRANDFTIEIVNFGTEATTNAVFTITGPLQLTLDGSLAGSDSGNACDSNNDGDNMSTLTCELGTVASGSTMTIDIEAWVGEWSGARDVTYAVTSDGDEVSPDPHPNSVTVSTVIGAVPITVPTVQITAPDGTSASDDTMTIDYSATATDDTDGDLSGQIQWSYRADGDPNAADVDLGTGAAGTFGPLAAGSYTLTASVTNSDGQSATDSVTLTVELGPPAEYDLAVFMPNLPPVIPVGEHITFPVMVHNFGTRLSPVYGLDLSTSSQFNAKIALGGGQVAEAYQGDMTPLGPGASRTFNVDITATDATPGQVNLAIFYYMGPNPEAANDRHPNIVTGTTTGGVLDPSTPTIEIISPETTPLSMPLDFITTANLSTGYSATASDAEDGDISDQITWTIRPLVDPNATWADVSTGAAGTLDPLDPGVYLLRASVTDADGNQASSTLVITSLRADISCSTTIDFRPVSGLYLPQIMTVNTRRSYDTCGRKLQFYWDAVYTAVSEADRVAFNEMMNNEDHSMTRGNFVIGQPDEWIVNLVVCLPAAGDIPARCELPVSRDWASQDIVIP